MRLIKGPVDLPYPPRACAVSNRIDGDFIDFQVFIDRPEPTRLYLKREVVEDAALMCGMVDGAQVEELRRQVVAMGDQIEQLQDYIRASEEAAQLKEAVSA